MQKYIQLQQLSEGSFKQSLSIPWFFSRQISVCLQENRFKALTEKMVLLFAEFFASLLTKSVIRVNLFNVFIALCA